MDRRGAFHKNDRWLPRTASLSALSHFRRLLRRGCVVCKEPVTLDRSQGGDDVPGHDLIVIGGSAGAVEALTAIAAGLPPDLRAAVCVVMHQPAYAPSRLPEILDRAGPLPAVAAQAPN
jgi:chemotaxis response regulator CheB